MSRLEELRKGKDKKSDLIVTIDGKSGAGKGTLGEFIADKLDLEHFSAGDVFRQIAEDRGMTHAELAEKADKEVDLEVDRRTLERGLENNCVIDSRIASRVLSDYSDLKIFVTADLEERAKRIAERENEELEKILEETRKRDEENSRRYKEYYGIETDNIHMYDLIIDNTEMNIEEQNELVEKVLRDRFPERFG